jgi:hypothetical protein
MKWTNFLKREVVVEVYVEMMMMMQKISAVVDITERWF